MTDYNETLRKVCDIRKKYYLDCNNKVQVSNSLANALDTFGPSSEQYQAILAILKECLQEIDEQQKTCARDEVVDADMLSAAMSFLDIGK